MINEHLAPLADTDQVVIRIDGGEYWGDYHAEPMISVQEDVPNGQVWLGHPGGPAIPVECKKVAILSD